VVNNCAAAVLLVLAALAQGRRRTIVSRGELIEIGDGFRIPEIMAQSGAILREVGTTNRTRLRDYESAINEKHAGCYCACIPPTSKITDSRKNLRSPNLRNLSAKNFRATGGGPRIGIAGRSVCQRFRGAQRCDRASTREFSGDVHGDKLLGGRKRASSPAKKIWCSAYGRHPLFRALRVDKLTIAALEVTLNAYLRNAGRNTGRNA